MNSGELLYGPTIIESQDVGNKRTRLSITFDGYSVDKIGFGHNNYDRIKGEIELIEFKLAGVSVNSNDYMFSDIIEVIPESSKLYIETYDPDGTFKNFDWKNTFGMQGLFRPTKDFLTSSEDNHDTEARILKLASKDRVYKFNNNIFNFSAR